MRKESKMNRDILRAHYIESPTSSPKPSSISGRSVMQGLSISSEASESFAYDCYRFKPRYRENFSERASTLSPCSSGRSLEGKRTAEMTQARPRKSFNDSPVKAPDKSDKKQVCSPVTQRRSSGSKLSFDSTPKKVLPNFRKNADEVSDTGSVGTIELRTPRRLSRSNEKPRRSTPGNYSDRDSVSTAETRSREDKKIASRNDDPFILEGPEVGHLLLKMAQSLHLSGDDPHKARYYALKAAEFFENYVDDDVSLELVTSLHLLSATCCKLGQYDECIPILKRSLAIFDIAEKSEHALGIFAGYMQLGDTYSLLGQYENALKSYDAGLEIQKQVLGEMDLQVADTCRYVAESHLQAMQFSEAEELCAHALKVHNEHNTTGTVQEASDRRLMALILAGKGDHFGALENLVLAGASLLANGRDIEVAFVDCSIGDSCSALGRYGDAISAYEKALLVFKTVHGEAHTSVASVYLSLADLYLKTGKFKEAKSHCEDALLIYGQQADHHSNDEIATGLTEISGLFIAMGEHKQALTMLQRALEIMQNIPGQQSAVGAIEAQIGVLFYLMGKHEEAYMILKKAVSKLRVGTQKRTWMLGTLLNQMGLACVGLNAIWDAAENFEEAKLIMEETCGPKHPDTLGVTSNLAGAYDAMGRLDDAINLLEGIVDVKEDRLGTVHPDVEEERQRLAELLKETGRARTRKPSTLRDLIFLKSKHISRFQVNSTSPVR